MSSKQKIAISAIGIVLVLAVIGLTIGLVLVASQATATNSMKVTYQANNVACTIQGSATGTGLTEATKTITATHKIGETVQDSGKIAVAATDNVQNAAIEFSEAVIEAADGVVTYTFVITNDFAEGGDDIYAHFTLVANATNMNVLLGTAADKSAVKTYSTAAIAPKGSATVVVEVSVANDGTEASWDESAMEIVVNKNASATA